MTSGTASETCTNPAGADFDAQVAHFKKIIPTDYKEMLRLTAKYEEQGMSHEEAQIEAFTEMTK